MVPALIGAVALGLGYVGAAYAGSIWQFALVQGVLIGLLGARRPSRRWSPTPRTGSCAGAASRSRSAPAATISPGTLWPPILQHFVESVGWRPTYVGIGLFCVATLLPLVARLPPPAGGQSTAPEPPPAPAAARPVSPTLVQALLIVAGVACCVAMSMPQVHIVAYCGDLGYGAARGAEMLSLMLGLGIVSRLVSGFISDRIGGLRTLLLGSVLQALALALFSSFDGLASLYVISALFGLFQGGIVPELRDHHPRVLSGPRGGRARRHRHHGDALRHGARRLDVGRDLRPDRLLPRRVPERHRLEPGELGDRVVAAAALAARASAGSRPGR